MLIRKKKNSNVQSLERQKTTRMRFFKEPESGLGTLNPPFPSALPTGFPQDGSSLRKPNHQSSPTSPRRSLARAPAPKARGRAYGFAHALRCVFPTLVLWTLPHLRLVFRHLVFELCPAVAAATMGKTADSLSQGARPDPVRSFNRWKKKHSHRQNQKKQLRKQLKKPEWQVEREGISRLVQNYEKVRPGSGSGTSWPLTRMGPAGSPASHWGDGLHGEASGLSLGTRPGDYTVSPRGWRRKWGGKCRGSSWDLVGALLSATTWDSHSSAHHSVLEKMLEMLRYLRVGRLML